MIIHVVSSEDLDSGSGGSSSSSSGSSSHQSGSHEHQYSPVFDDTTLADVNADIVNLVSDSLKLDSTYFQ